MSGIGTSPRRSRKRVLILTGRLACSMGVEDGAYQVQDVQRFREGPAEVEGRVKAQAQIDGPNVPVRIEQEPGSAGKIVIDHYARHVLPSELGVISEASGPAAAKQRGRALLPPPCQTDW